MTTTASNPSNSPPLHDNLPRHLSKGYARYRDHRLSNERERFRHLAEFGQKPPVLLIGCCDSRVAPEVIFEAGPGEIFVMRNIGALVPPFAIEDALPETSAAIEYAVLALKVAHIVVMGHSQCGGIRAFASGAIDQFKPLSADNYIGKWKRLIQPAADRIGPPAGDFDQYCESLCHASIIQGLANLRTYPWLREREAAGTLALHGACFGVADAHMTVLDQASHTFVPAITTPGEV